MSFQLFILLYALALGLVVGSYLNVVIHRLPRGVSTVLPRSRCPGCGAAIRMWDNIPLLSFVWLRGRCRHCGMRISWRYPAVELATGLGFVMCFEQFGPGVPALVGALFICSMIVLATIDLEHYLLPDRVTLPGIAAGLFLQPWIPGVSLSSALTGAALGGGILLAVTAAWYVLRGEEGMGLGDAKMLAMIGAFLGWKGMLVALFAAFFAGALVGVVLMARGGGSKTRLPFGAFLAGTAIASLFFGQPVADAYLRLL
jgi:leader peptidase (prepilin peptidase)/N-methyltransferase